MPESEIPQKAPKTRQSCSSRRSIECRRQGDAKPTFGTLRPRIGPKGIDRSVCRYAKLGMGPAFSIRPPPLNAPRPDSRAEEEVTSKTCETLLGAEHNVPAPVLPCSSGGGCSNSPLAASARQGEQSAGRQDQSGQPGTGDGAGDRRRLAEYRDAAQRAGSVGTVGVGAGERYENIAVERIDRDRMGT